MVTRGNLKYMYRNTRTKILIKKSIVLTPVKKNF